MSERPEGQCSECPGCGEDTYGPSEEQEEARYECSECGYQENIAEDEEEFGPDAGGGELYPGGFRAWRTGQYPGVEQEKWDKYGD